MEQTFCFVDLAGFSALTETHGDETAADLVERFTTVVEEALEGDGQRVATIGDAVFVVSANPGAALAFLARLWVRADEEPHFPALRAGLHHGEAARRGPQYYGAAVNLAARVAAQASGGQVLATASVAHPAREVGLAVQPLGAVSLKNLRGECELFAISVGAERTSDVIDPVCRMRVSRQRAAAHLDFEGTQHWFCSRECLQQFVKER
jgi:class 3 adenylate cyclase/YHS domain-containing protein